MSQGTELIRVRLASEVVLIDVMQEVVQRLLEKMRVVEDEVFWVSLAIREAVINGMKHGNHFDPAKHVEMGVSLSGTRIRVEVCDEGEGFEPSDVPDPLSEENLLKPSGRGIFYMRSFMDSIQYRKGGRHGTCVVMEKTLTIQPPAEEAS